ncbi:transporter, CPA2 family [Persephonella hydrogeniphila]|uniref:Transporter, CPA2 family n=1 Tax=Persephonella hydrogeniphila TaxID=198703 RepID=A0A285NMH3_9AQUI|nr:cation:proton antiporter [Persephonella hydrogeniphila]SNZ10157.1 transporter, CPA2 family [Persephonella hydrogeniphila]
MSKEESILLLVVSVGAFVIPFISRKLMLPSAVGEIIFGLVIGIFFNKATESMTVIHFLGSLGFLILMYLAGLEINFERIKITPKRELIIYFISLFIIIALSFFVALYFDQPKINILVYLTIAIGLLYPVLKDTGLIHTDFAQSTLIIASLGEVISLVFISAFFMYFEYGFSEKTFIHLFEIYLFFFIAYLILKAFQLYAWWNPKKVFTFIKTEDPTETDVRANFANMFIFAALASLLGLEYIIGAFFGGMLFAMIFKKREQIQEKISSFGYGFLIPVFFIEVGLRFDLFNLLKKEIILGAFMISITILLIRVAGAFPLLFSGFRLKEILAFPFALSMPLTLLVAIATLGLETKVIPEDYASMIVLSALISGILYPWLFKLITRIY